MGTSVDSSASARRRLAATVHDDAATLPTLTDDAPEPGGRVGRYLLLERIGMGGMGIVYAAFDPDLDRRVALKLLRGNAGETRADLRLLREARALAKLTHPNVVPVFDAGVAGGRPYVAMEFVEGLTLTRWLAARPRSRAEILRVFGEAGRGLAAAHAMGIVHRDFKPDNVLLGGSPPGDGLGVPAIVRVGDFGLARPVAAISSRTSAESIALASDAHEPLDPSHLTRAGLVLGTPAYMAPEQHRGEDATPASDQYALCVSLYEALYGTRPFAGATARELVRRKNAGELSPAPDDRAVPAWLHETIVRGLAASPDARWPDLSTLLARLEQGPTRGRARTAVLAVGACALVLAIAWPSAPAPCEDDTRLAQVWNPQRREAARAAFASTGLGYSTATWTRTEALVDAYAGGWADMRRENCVAATTNGGLAAAELDGRTRCLDDRLAALDAVVGVLVDADTVLVQHAVTTAAGLPALAACAQSESNEGESDPTRGAERQSIGQGLTRTKVLENAGRYHSARGEAELLLSRAERLGDPGMLAAAHGQLGSALHRVGEYEAARHHLEEGVWLGTAANDDVVVANAALDLVWLEGVDHADDVAALEWARHAAAAIERAGEEQGRAQLAIAVGAVHSSHGHHAQALAEFERARAMYVALGDGYRSDLATAHQNLGITLDSEGRHAEGRDELALALALYEEVQGPDHPETANALDALAGALLHLGELDGARARFERALEIRSAALPVGHPDLARSHNNVGSLLDALGEYDAAARHFRRALEVFTEALGPTHPYLGATLANLANVQYHLGDHATARASLQRALEILTAELPADHPFVLQTAAWLARSEAAVGDADAARRHAEPVLTACGAGAGDATICAHARFALARARTDDPAEAQELARGALAELRSAGRFAQRDAEEIQRWLDADE